MSGLMDKIGDKANQALDKKAQPGDGAERKADGDVNSGEHNNIFNGPGKCM